MFKFALNVNTSLTESSTNKKKHAFASGCDIACCEFYMCVSLICVFEFVSNFSRFCYHSTLFYSVYVTLKHCVLK